VGPAGFEPATKRFRVQIQFGLYFTLLYSTVLNQAAVNLAYAGSNPVWPMFYYILSRSYVPRDQKLHSYRSVDSEAIVDELNPLTISHTANTISCTQIGRVNSTN